MKPDRNRWPGLAALPWSGFWKRIFKRTASTG